MSDVAHPQGEEVQVLADEPTGNLDTASSDEVFVLLRRMHVERGTSFVVVTHGPAPGRAMKPGWRRPCLSKGWPVAAPERLAGHQA